ncbi:MAG: hypothetical protein OQK48_01355 [Sulfurimonas sp.]|uniref:hypothetical protein n=1 Tax=Sulfurimonas sp. TaxID=2022749 RepID=UPI002629482F|nr:hypothetical protein [Sulfurimonas sp.]MCW8894985.1 hypothetical protein [Sulfurimonas sp.]MCW8953569.1 hypothetical protein [Sulfurimonas sp.]MCW9066859.1 hypothetical protein [Sulfurimonas sp.]
MLKLIFLSAFFTLILIMPLNARGTFKGQKIYLKECRTCHMGSKIFLNKYTLDEWEKALRSSDTLAYVHLSKNVKNVNSKDGTIKDSHSYFKSNKYKKQYHHLKNFIIEFVRKNDKNFYNQ